MHTYGVELLLWTGGYTRENIDLIAHAKEIGFDGVEIHLASPETIPVEETKKALKELDMQVSFAVTLNEDTNAISPDPEVRKRSVEYFKKCVDTAYALSGGNTFIGGVNYAAWGYFTGKARTEQEWEWAVKSFRDVAGYAKEFGFVLAVEAINRFETHFLNSASDGVQFCKDVGEPNVKVHLDTYHMIREEKNLYRAIVDTGVYLGYFHACENERGVPGEGLVPWEEVYHVEEF